MKNFLLINKAVFFPKEGIIAIGDLHLGYEKMLKTSGFEFPINQIKETTQELEKIFEEIKKKGFKIKKIIILGDLKHHFNFEVEEKFEIRKLLSFLEGHLPREKIIILKGNHEKVNLKEANYREYFIEKGVAFVHGDKSFPEILDKKIKTIVMGHLHPAVLINDPKSHKKEKYKCFLVGKWKNKETIILPSFLQIVEGTDIRSESARHKDQNFLIIPRKSLLKFKVFIPDKRGKVLEFPTLEKLAHNL